MRPKRDRGIVRRAFAPLLAACLCAVLSSQWLTRPTAGSAVVVSAPLIVEEKVPEPPTTTTTTAPPPAVSLARPAQPIVIPANSYASEPIVELGTIEIPRLGLNHRTFQGVTLNNIDHGPAHWPGTALPGEVGNTVFAGHRVTRTRPFRNIDQLAPGDEVIFTMGGRRSVYRVTGNQIVKPHQSEIADQPSDAYTGTIYACHPPGSAAYRIVVHLRMDAPPA